MNGARIDITNNMGPAVSRSIVTCNSFGPASGAGVKCEGQEDWFDRNNFFGDYPGWESSAGSVGLICFTKTTAGNRLTRMRPNGNPAMCGQVDDQTGGSNIVPGYERCETS